MGDSDRWLYGKEEAVGGTRGCGSCPAEPLGVSGGALSCLEAGRERQECG